MDKTKLNEIGINYDEGVHRFGDQSTIYEKFLYKVFEKNYIEQIESLVNKKQYYDAFKVAHDFKGVTGNLSMNKLYLETCNVVEDLRNEVNEENLYIDLEKIKKTYEMIKKEIVG